MGNVGKAIGRIFTPPGTGGAEAAAEQAATDAARAAQAAKTAAAPAPPATPAPPAPPPPFAPATAAGQRQILGQKSASSILGSAAVSGQTAKKSVLG